MKIEGKRFGVFGASGCGKTFLSQRMIAKKQNVIIIDPKNEISISGYTKVRTKKEFILHLSECEKKKKNIKIIIWGVDCVDVGNFALTFVFEHKKTGTGEITFFVDECQEFCPSGTARRDNYNPLLIVSRMGRSRGISLVVASQRINTVDINLRGNLNTLILFRQGEYSDAQTVKRMIGVDLFNLPPREFYIKTDNGSVSHFKRAQDYMK